jgi:hypothetical protein
MADSLAGLGDDRKGERKYTGKFAEQGTTASGFASDGPYHCEDCIHQENRCCYHPAVMNDPDLPDMPDGTPAEERKQDDGSIRVDKEVECCEFVRTKNDV